jgi:hypothetical protein
MRCVALLLLLISFSQSIQAQRGFYVHDDEMDIGVVPRISPDAAESAIVTTDGMVYLLLTEKEIVIQFSDKKLDQIAADIDNEEMSMDESHFGTVLRTMVSSGIRTLLDRGLAIPLYEIGEISYNSGRLIILNMQGKEIFEDLEIDNQPVMEQFSRRDARGFISAVERKMI